MEALCATQVTLLTIYDMCKAVDRGMQIDLVRVLEKIRRQLRHWKKKARNGLARHEPFYHKACFLMSAARLAQAPPMRDSR